MNGEENCNDIFHTGQDEVNKMRENLEKLYNLTDEDKTNESLLQARIEEQSHLIMMLKKRADEYLLRCQVLDKENKEFETQLTTVTEKSKSDEKKSRIVYGNFTKLVQTHDEMKMEFENVKRINQKLKTECDQLKSEIVSLTENLKNQSLVETVNDELTKMTLRNIELELELKILNEKSSKEISQNQLEIKKNREIVDLLKSDIKQKDEDINNYRMKSESAIEKLKNDNSISANEIKNMKKQLETQLSIVKKNSEEIIDLTKKSKTFESLYRELKDKYQKESETFNVNSQVQKLKTELQMEEVKFRELRQDYEAYKIYSNKLLQTEKELSSRLRKLYS